MTATPRSQPLAYAAAAIGIGVLTTGAALLRNNVNGITSGLAMLLVIALVARWWGTGPGLFAAAFGTVALSYLLLPIIYTSPFAGQSGRWTVLTVFLATALPAALFFGRSDQMARMSVDSTAHLAARILGKHHQAGDHCPHCYHVKDLATQFDSNSRNVAGKTVVYKWSAMVLLVLLPLMSAVLSVLLSEQRSMEDWSHRAKVLSYGLTILTLLNAIFKPGERFRELCTIGLKMQELRDDFISALEALTPEPHEKQIHEICKHFEQDLLPFETRLISMFLPDAPAEAIPSRQNAGETGGPRNPGPAGKHA